MVDYKSNPEAITLEEDFAYLDNVENGAENLEDGKCKEEFGMCFLKYVFFLLYKRVCFEGNMTLIIYT